jgi:hypothetical protein
MIAYILDLLKSFSAPNTKVTTPPGDSPWRDRVLDLEGCLADLQHKYDTASVGPYSVTSSPLAFLELSGRAPFATFGCGLQSERVSVSATQEKTQKEG